MLMRIEMKYMCAGAVSDQSVIRRSAPILRWSIGKSTSDVIRWATSHPKFISCKGLVEGKWIDLS